MPAGARHAGPLVVAATTAKPIKSLTTALTALFAVLIGVCVIVVVVRANLQFAMIDYRDGDRSFAPLRDLEQAVDASNTIQSLLLALMIATFVVIIIWTHRAYRNLATFGVTRYRLGTGMAIGSWFIPVYSWIGPKQIINDIWRGSAPEPIDDNWTRRPVAAVVTVWWCFWVAGNLLTSVGSFRVTTFSTESVDPVFDIAANINTSITFNSVALVGELALVAATVLGLIATRRIGQRHHSRLCSVSARP